MNLKRIITIASTIIFANVLLISSLANFEILADASGTKDSEKPWVVPNKMSVNDLMIKVQIQNSDGQIEYDTFTSFKQTSGFKSKNESPKFKLEGLVGPEKHYLYEMADYFYNYGQSMVLGKYDGNKFIISLEYNGIPVRSFEYTDCDVTNYYVETLYDGISTYQEDQRMSIAFVDQFEFVCEGYKPHNNYYAALEKQERMEQKSQTTKEVKTKQ